MKKRIFLYLFICLVLTLYWVNANASISDMELDIVFLGDFKNYKYEPMPGENALQTPTIIESWPGEFYQPPDVLIVKSIITNVSNMEINDVLISVKIKFKVGESNENLEESQAKSTWGDGEYLLDTIKIKTLASNQTANLQICEIDLFKLFNDYEDQGLRPWACQAIVTYQRANDELEISKIIPLELIWD